MNQSIAQIALLVRDYDDALAFYTRQLDFIVVEDTPLPEQRRRWITIAPPGHGARLLLARAEDDAERSRIGDQTGGRVFLFLYTDNFWRDHARYTARGVTFLETPRVEPYGIVAVFQDLYGNRWDLLQPT